MTPLELKKRPDDYILMHERPASAQQYVKDIATLQDKGTKQQDPEVPMDQLGSHVSPTEVGSSSHSTRSGTTHGTREEACAAMELEALQNYPHVVSSETPSE